MPPKRIILILAVIAVVAFSSFFLLLFQQASKEPEVRTLPSFVTLYELPRKNSAPIAITVASSGEVWYASSNGSRIGVFKPASGEFREYQIPGGERVNEIWSLVIDSNGELLFPSVVDNAIFKFSPSTERFTSYPIPTNNSFPLDLVLDGRGRVWFTELFGGKLGVLDPNTGIFEEFTPPTSRPGLAGLFLKGDSLWFTEAFKGRIGRFDITTGTFEEFSPPEVIVSPVGVTLDAEGAVWFAEHGSNMFGRLKPGGEVIRYPTSAGMGFPFSLPYWVEFDKLGRMWFNEHGGNRIAVFNPEDSALTEYAITLAGLGDVLRFSRGPDGRLWFTQTGGNKIGYVDPSRALKLQISTDPEHITLAPGEATKIRLSLTGNSQRRLSFKIISNIDNAGVAVNMTATFDPSTVQLDGRATSIMTLRATESLKPGKYILGVSASDGETIHIKMLPLTVVKKR